MNVHLLQNFLQEIEENLGDESENLYGYIKEGVHGWLGCSGLEHQGPLRQRLRSV